MIDAAPQLPNGAGSRSFAPPPDRTVRRSGPLGGYGSLAKVGEPQQHACPPEKARAQCLQAPMG